MCTLLAQALLKTAAASCVCKPQAHKQQQAHKKGSTASAERAKSATDMQLSWYDAVCCSDTLRWCSGKAAVAWWWIWGSGGR